MADNQTPKFKPAKMKAAAPIVAATPAAAPVVPFVQAPEPEPVLAPLAMTAAIPDITPAPVAVEPKKDMTMDTNTIDNTINTATTAAQTTTENMADRASAMFGDMNGRAKDAVAKGTKAIEELVEFSKGNLEAMMTSGRIAAKGAEDIAKYSAEYGRSTMEKANATAKQFASVKSPTEFFQLQGEIAKQTLDALVAEGSKFTESYLKLVGEVSQPISNRVSLAAEKVKSTVA